MAEKTLKTFLDKLLNKCLEGRGIEKGEAEEFASIGDDHAFEALSVTDAVRRRFKGTKVSLCSIVNAKSGLCKEDCSFCSQSTRYSTGVAEYPMKDAREISGAARDASMKGAREFSIVASGTAVEKEGDLQTLFDALSDMKRDAPVERCASLGILREDTLKRLKEKGLQSYHHNLETGRSFFPNVCTTHGYDEDVRVVRTAKALGLRVCSGGIFGLGEAWADRIELALTLRELDVDSIPINFLNPRPGTPLEGAGFLTPLECLRIISLYRLMFPAKDIIVCGGRELNLRGLKCLVFPAGANGILTGNYLTTTGTRPEDDLEMIEDLGLRPRGYQGQ